MGDPASFRMELPAEFLEQIGDYKAALKQVRDELRDVERDAKKVIKEGGSVSGDQLLRIQQLSDQKERIMEAQRLARSGGTAGEAARAVYSARDKLGNASRVLHGNISVRDFRDVGYAIRDKAAAWGARLKSGSAAQRFAGRAAEFGGSLGSSALRVAGIAGIAAMGTTWTLGMIGDEFTRRKTRTAGDLEIANRLYDETRASSVGTSGQYTAADMIGFNSLVASSGARGRSIARAGSLKERTWGRLVEALGWTQSEDISDAETKEQNLSLDVDQAQRKYGASLGRLDRNSVFFDRQDEIMRAVSRKYSYGTGGSGYWSRGVNYMLGTSESKDAAISAEIEAEISQKQTEIIKAEEQRRSDEMRSFTGDARYARARAVATQSTDQLRSVEVDRLKRLNDYARY